MLVPHPLDGRPGRAARFAWPLLGAAVALSAACTSSRRAAPPPLPAPAIPDAPPIEHRTAAREFRWRDGTLVYTVSSESAIDVRGDTLPADTVRVQALVTYRIGAGETPGATLRVGGTVDGYEVRSSRPGFAATDTLPLPISFVGALGPGGLALEGIVEPPPAPAESAAAADTLAPVEQPCAAALSAPLALARDLVLLPPPALTIGTTWSDTTVTTLCRGGVPVTTTAVRHFAVVGSTRLGGAEAAAIERTSEITIAGRARLHGRDVAVAGSGRGRTTFYASSTEGAFLGSDGSFETDLTIESGTRRQQFVQSVRQRTRLRGVD